MTTTRIETLRAALIATLTADAATCEQVFTSDVSWSSPTLTASSRDELETLLSSRAGALSGIAIDITSAEETDNTLRAEWQVAALHDRAFVVPSDANLAAGSKPVTLAGTTFAEFTGARISKIRHDFDEEAMMAELGR